MPLRRPRFLAVSALCGALGVLSGYAIFLTWLQVIKALPAEHEPLRFCLTLLFTAVIAYIIEWIRELIREGRIEHAAHPFFRTMGTFVIVLLFELFITGFHTSSDLKPDALRTAAALLLGPGAPASTWTLIFTAALWIVVGALQAAWLSRGVHDSAGTTLQRVGRASGVGLGGGVIVAPLVMGLYIVAGRCLVALGYVFQVFGGGGAAGGPTTISDLWHNIFLSQNSAWKMIANTLVFLVTLPFNLLVLAAHHNLWIFLALFLPMAVFAIGYPIERRRGKPMRRELRIVLGFVWTVCLLHTLSPFAIALFRVLGQLAHTGPLWTLTKIVALAALLWGVPGALLGGLTPLLRRVATHTRNWAFVGYGAAALLLVATLIVHAWWALVPAAAALAVGYMFQRGAPVAEYWPFAALCVAAGICGATSIAQHATFAGVIAKLHAIDSLRPAPPAEPAVAYLLLSYDQLSPTEHARLRSSSYPGLDYVRTDSGSFALVTEREVDAETLKRVQQMVNPAEMHKLIDYATSGPDPALIAAEQKTVMAGFVHVPELDAAVASLAPGAPPVAAPKPGKKTKAPGPPPDPFDTIDREMAEMHAMDPSDFPAPSTPAAPVKGNTPAAAEAPSLAPPPEATPPAPAPAAAPQTPAAAPSAAKPGASSKSADSEQLNPDDPAVQDRIAEALELSISGSVGFWVAVGLLACWSMQESEDGEPHHATAPEA